MVKTKDEIMEEIRAYIGDRSDDQTISLIENISDTIDDTIDEMTGKDIETVSFVFG